ncbi:hypothetical protein CASFOL_035281 [Castilleja foliolosa]|uniref:Uncharacterized protein n=1 Tax=Castilleja foliolosa TaxID=1961234 RepID=A0ABD3BSX1_9LAMI
MDRDGWETQMDREMERREMEREMERRGIGRREMEIEILRSETEREMEERILRRWPRDLAPRNPRRVTRALRQTSPEPRHTRLAVEVHHDRIPVGIDLVCNGCQHHVPGSQDLWISYRCYERNTRLPPLRCFADCPNCYHDWELLKLPDNKFALCAGATHDFPAAEIVPMPTPAIDDGPLVL